MSSDDIAVVVAVDFGTTFSGFAYSHVRGTNNVVTNNKWPARTSSVVGQYKCNTVLYYSDDGSWTVEAWGCGAVASTNRRARSRDRSLVAELFKLHLIELDNNAAEKPVLPEGLDYRQAIRDFLSQMNEVIQSEVTTRWTSLRYPQNVRFVFSVPAEYDDPQRMIMRKIIFEAGFTETETSSNLQFTTEPEAAALYCLRMLKQYSLRPQDHFLIVDCGGGTVDLTVRRLEDNAKLGEMTERTGAPCGGTFVDREFVKFLDGRLDGAVSQVKQDNYHDFQHLVDYFCKQVKFGFTGDRDTFGDCEIDLSTACPSIKRYVSSRIAGGIEEDDWVLEVSYDEVKAMFDPVVDQIIELIRDQVRNAGTQISSMFLVGGFSESQYLQRRVKEEFRDMGIEIACPTEPATAIMRGAAYYGLDKGVIKTRVLKWTYGLATNREWISSDPPERRRQGLNKIAIFERLAARGSTVEVDQQYTLLRQPLYPNQRKIAFAVHVTKGADAKYPDDPGVRLLGKLVADLPDEHLGINRPVLFMLSFGEVEITAKATNQLTGQEYVAKWDFDI